MRDRASPLAQVAITGSYGAQFTAGAGVALSEKLVVSLVQIAGWGGIENDVMPAIKAFGFNEVGSYRRCTTSKDNHLYRIAPARVLIAAQTVLIHRTAVGRFEINIPVTWVRGLWDFICRVVTPFGYDVRATA